MRLDALDSRHLYVKFRRTIGGDNRPVFHACTIEIKNWPHAAGLSVSDSMVLVILYNGYSGCTSRNTLSIHVGQLPHSLDDFRLEANPLNCVCQKALGNPTLPLRATGRGLGISVIDGPNAWQNLGLVNPFEQVNFAVI